MNHNNNRKQADNSFAVLIGVGDYLSPQLVSLPATVRDAQTLAAILSDPNRCGYAHNSVQAIIGSNATAVNIRAALESLAQSTNSESTIFLYFSGHGGRAWENNQWNTYLCPLEADPSALAHTAISGSEFSKWLASLPARKLLVILDACHAAGSAELKATDGTIVWKTGLPDSYYEALSKGAGRVIIASSREDQASYIRPQGDLSLFTHHLVQALSGGAAVRGDGLIRVLDTFHYVSELVQANHPGQTPILKVSDLDLNFPIALDRGGKGNRAIATPAAVATIREQVVRDAIAGAKALSNYLASHSDWASKRNEVDLKRGELERIQHDLDLFGPDPSSQAAKNRAIYFLLRMCLDLEQAKDSAVSNTKQHMESLDDQLQKVDAKLDRLCLKRDPPPSTVTSSQPDTFPQIVTLPHILLTDEERSLLQYAHQGCSRILIEKEFSGGYSGTRVLLILPIMADGRHIAHKVTKLGSALELRQERDKYEKYVGSNLPFCVARVEGEKYYEYDNQASLNYIFVGGGALGKAMTMEHYYCSTSLTDTGRLIKTLNELLDKNLGQSWYSQSVPLACFFAAEYGRHLVEHIRLRLRPASSDTFLTAPPPQRPSKITSYQQLDVEAIPHEHEKVQAGTLLFIEGLVIRKITHGVVKLAAPGDQGVVVRVEFSPESNAVQTLKLNDIVGVRGEVLYNRRARMAQITRAIFPELLPEIDRECITLPNISGTYPNPLRIYPQILDRLLRGRKSYVHGDLHLRNVLVDESGKGWLIDFAKVEERHNLFDFIKLETYVRLMVLACDDLTFSIDEYIRFEETLADATLGRSVPALTTPPLRFAFDVIMAIRRIAQKYMGPDPDFQHEYFPALFLYCLAVMKYYQEDTPQPTRLAFTTACIIGHYLTGGDADQKPPVVPQDRVTTFIQEPIVCTGEPERPKHKPDTTQVSMVDTDSFDITAVRQRLKITFDDAELDAFCMDYFPQVFDRFGRGMRKDEKINLLLDYCRRLPTRQQRLIVALKGKTE